MPADTVPADTVPADTVPADTVPADTVPADTVPADEAIPPALATHGPGDLIIGAIAPARETVKQLQQDFELAFRLTAECKCDEVKVERIDFSGYKVLERFFGGPDRPSIISEYVEVVERSTAQSEYWNVYLRDPFQDIASLTLTYRVNEEVKAEKFDVGEKGDETARLRYHSPGYCIFRTEPNWEPEGYVLVTEARDGTKKEHPARKWPVTDKYFAITLRGFQGDPKALFDVLRDPKQVGTALKDVLEVRPTSVVLANFVRDFAVGGDSWNKNEFTVRFTPPGGETYADRIWMLFPLSKDELASARERLLGMPLTKQDFAQWIRKGSGLYKPFFADQDAVLRPETKAMWYEIPPVYSEGLEPKIVAFQRIFRVEEIEAWKENPSFTQVHRMVAYEFEAADGTKLMLMVDSEGRDGEGDLWLEEEVRAWPIGLRAESENE